MEDITEYRVSRTIEDAFGYGSRLYAPPKPSNTLLWLAVASALIAVGTGAFWLWTAPF